MYLRFSHTKTQTCCLLVSLEPMPFLFWCGLIYTTNLNAYVNILSLIRIEKNGCQEIKRIIDVNGLLILFYCEIGNRG